MDNPYIDFIDFSEFDDMIRGWSSERNIYAESSPKDQAEKVHEELEELYAAINEGDREGVKDAVGDIMVGLRNVIFYYDLSTQECFEHAYNEIKDRKGKMICGKFVKEDDLK